MIMLSKIIHFLGGFTLLEYLTLNLEFNQQRAALDSMRQRVSYLETECAKIDDERKETQRLLYKYSGITPPSDATTPDVEVNPIKVAPNRWSQLKSAMEKDDYNRVSSLGGNDGA